LTKTPNKPAEDQHTRINKPPCNGRG
jgi:hypothetical protein